MVCLVHFILHALVFFFNQITSGAGTSEKSQTFTAKTQTEMMRIWQELEMYSSSIFKLKINELFCGAETVLS